MEVLVAAHSRGHEQLVFAIEATGSLHRPWVSELERRYPGTVRLFAPSQTKAARTQLGSNRFKTDDRDCAALTYLARQGAGHAVGRGGRGGHAARSGPAPSRTGGRPQGDPTAAARPAQRAGPRLSAPAGHGRSLALEQPSGQAVLACAAAFAGRAPTVGSLQTRASGRFSASDAGYWADRWRGCLPPPHDADLRAERLRRDLARYHALQADIAALEAQLEQLLAQTDGQVLTTPPGVAVVRASGFAAFTLPISRFPDAEHLCSATGLAPALYESATVRRRGR